MVNEKEAVEQMRKYPNLREDLFTLKWVREATGLSRTMLIRLENEGFITPRKVDEWTGWRYYDTFNIFKLLQYRRLRMIGLTRSEIFAFYQSGNESLADTLEQMQERRRLLDQNIEILSLRLNKERNYSFSFYDFDEMTCLTAEGEVSDLVDANTLGYNLSVEAVARGLRPLVTEEMFCENEDRYAPSHEERKAPWRIKVYQPVDAGHIPSEMADGIEAVPACRTFSILVYGLRDSSDMSKPRELLLAEIQRHGLVPTGAPVRVQAIVAKYTAMQLDEDEHVMRIAVPVQDDAG